MDTPRRTGATPHPGVAAGQDAHPGARAGADACPGVLRLLPAADGHLARIRLVGGFLTAPAWSTLADAADDLGDGRAELTSRGNLQLRGLDPDAATTLAPRLATAALWPSPTHERIRNIIATPLAGVDRDTDLTPLIHALDEALCAVPRLANLSGRFLFALDDGRNDVTHLGADIVIQAGWIPTGRNPAGGDPGHRNQGGGSPGGWVNGLWASDPIATAIAFAVAFLDERAAQHSDAWRITDLTDGADRVRARVAAALAPGTGPDTDPVDTEPPDLATSTHADPPPAGLVTRHDGGTGLVIAVPLGRLDSDQMRWLARVTESGAARLTAPGSAQVTGSGDASGARPGAARVAGLGAARVTPWRSVVLPEAGAAVRDGARGMGFGVEAGTPWAGVSACAGRPGCGKALADVQRDARAALGRWPGRVVHWSGCERRCGRSARTEIDVVATPTGYRIEGQ